jgi:DNA-directed RNA polymerase subunit RPC12/RpoP
MLRRLWGNATPAERSSFLEWVKTAPVEDDEDQFKCNSCEATFADDSEGVSLYECNDCGTRFTQDTSANGNHQCPDCNKFGSKVSDCGCPECGDGELEQCFAVANN